MVTKSFLQLINKYLPERIKLKISRLYSRLPFSLPRIGFTPLLECNYSCSYCFDRNYINPYFPKTYNIDYREWIFLFNKFPTSLVTIGGGEPLIYKDIYKLIKGISKKHIISQIITNLSVNLDLLIRIRDVGFRVMASFHPEMISKEEFLKNLLFIKREGVRNVVINYVATPKNLEKYQEYRDFFEREIEFYFRLDAYEDLERNLRDFGQFPIYGVNYVANRERFNTYSSKKCLGGYRYLVVMPDGNVYRCGISLLYIYSQAYRKLANPIDINRFLVGNLKDEKFKLSAKYFVCHSPCRWICDIELANVKIC